MALLEERFGPWKPISRLAGTCWLVFFGLFLVYALLNRSGFLILDFVNLMAHEAGHPFFSWFGSETLTALGGTLGELLVPLLCGAYFFVHREVAGTAFCGFWFFENFPYIGTYMADARAEALPLVGNGDHDWNFLFGQWGWLALDTRIGGTVRLIGWLGMVLVIAWLARRTFAVNSGEAAPDAQPY